MALEKELEEPPASLEIRQALVNTAVDFLNMDKILVQPQDKKRQFLLKKGLTEEEIEIAFKNSRIPLKENYGYFDIEAQNSVSVRRPSKLPTPFAFPYQSPRTLWTVIRDSFNMFLYVTGIILFFKYMYENYVSPFLTGKKHKTKEEMLLEVQASITDVLQHLESTLEKINNNILQNEKVADEKSANKLEIYHIEEIKTELGTIKSLLVNRNTFAAAPALSHSIPEWQKLNKQLEEKENTETHSSDKNFVLDPLDDNP